MRALLLAFAVAGCQQVGVGPGPDVAVSGLRLVPAASGLSVEGSGGREIGFGRDRAGVIASVGRVEGRVPRPVPCAGQRSGAITQGGVTLVFEAERFVG